MKSIGCNIYRTSNIICSYLGSADHRIKRVVIQVFQEMAWKEKYPSLCNEISSIRFISEEGEKDLNPIQDLSVLTHQKFKEWGTSSFQMDDALMIFSTFIEHFYASIETTESSIEILELFQYINSNRELHKILSAIFYAIHFSDNELLLLAIENGNSRHMAAFVLQTIAEHCEEETLQDIVRSLSLRSKVIFILELNRYYREGSYHALTAFLEAAESAIDQGENVLENRELIYCIQGFRKHLATLDEIESNVGDIHPDWGVDELVEANAKLRAKVENEAELLIDVLQRGILFFTSCAKPSTEYIKFIWENFKNFLPLSFSKGKGIEFIHKFGLVSHHGGDYESDNSHTLPTKIGILLDTIMSDTSLTEDSKFAMPFLHRVYMLYSSLCNYRYFNIGLSRMVFGIPTCGKDLSKLPIVASLLRSLKSLPPKRTLENVAVVCKILGSFVGKIQHIVEQYTGETHVQPRSIRSIPIVIIDQSDVHLFQKNREYLERMAAIYDATICHISKGEAIVLAQRLRVEDLVVTKENYFGFGGARNAIFLLSPVIAEVERQGYLTGGARLIDIKPSKLRRIFEERVLNVSGEDTIVHMDDDDIEVRESSLLPDIISAAKNKGKYFLRVNETIGRKTTIIAGPILLSNSIEDPKYDYSTTKWENKPTPQSMSSTSMSKPRFCLNLPLGDEEEQDIFVARGLRNVDSNDLRTSYFHLPGRRFLLDKIPSSTWTNLAAHLQKAIPAGFTPDLVETFVYGTQIAIPEPNHILPWHKEATKLANEAQSLFEMFTFVVQHEKELTYNFWMQMFNSWNLPPIASTSNRIISTIANFMDQDFAAIAATFINTYPLYRDEFVEIRDVYVNKKIEMELLYFFGKAIITAVTKKTRSFLPEDFDRNNYELIVTTAIEKGVNFLAILEEVRLRIEREANKPINQMPMLEALYLITKSLGCGGFCRAVQKAIA